MENRCIIVSGGTLGPVPAREDGDLVIACDRGYAYCERLGVRPDIFVGDFDSFSGAVAPGVTVERLKPEKDDTDSALAVDTALSLGYRKLYLIGGLGGRLDHTLNNVFLLEDIRKKGAECVLTDGKNRAYLAEEKNEIVKNGRKYVSLIPLDEIVYDVEMRGFFYPFKTEKLLRRRFVTVSNELTGDRGEISVGSGTALIVETV